MGDYEQLHRQCRTLENLFDSKLTSYSQVVATISQSSRDVEATGSPERWRDMEAELDDLLEKARILMPIPLERAYTYRYSSWKKQTGSWVRSPIPLIECRRQCYEQSSGIESSSRTVHAN